MVNAVFVFTPTGKLIVNVVDKVSVITPELIVSVIAPPLLPSTSVTPKVPEIALKPFALAAILKLLSPTFPSLTV
jgi:hypothetical protein